MSVQIWPTLPDDAPEHGAPPGIAEVERARRHYFALRAAGCNHREALHRAGFVLSTRDYNELARELS